MTTIQLDTIYNLLVEKYGHLHIVKMLNAQIL